MKSTDTKRLFIPILFLFIVPFFSSAASGGDGEIKPIGSLFHFEMVPGGDVLRPSSPGLPWHVGIDAGITYSSFYNGPLMLINLKNPYNPSPLALRSAIANTGSGLGFVIGGTVDYSFSKKVGLVGKIQYNTRSGKFSSSSKEYYLLPPDTVNYSQDFTWTFNYISFDLLLRYQIIEKSLYILVGPSFSSLQSNKVKLDEKLLNPNLYYTEGDGSTNNMYKTLSSETEIGNVEKSRIELKLGLGTWIPIAKKLYLTPEAMFAFPLGKLITSNAAGSDITFNMWTLFATVGLRWEL